MNYECKKCGYVSNNKDILFCPYCGTKLIQDTITVKGRRSGNSTVLTAPKQAIDREYIQQVLHNGIIQYTPVEGGNLDV